MNVILFGIYIIVLLVIFAFIALVVMHIGSFRQYSRYLSVVLRIYLVAIIIIAFIGGYKILTSTYIPMKASQNQKVEF